MGQVAQADRQEPVKQEVARLDNGRHQSSPHMLQMRRHVERLEMYRRCRQLGLHWAIYEWLP